MEHLNWKNSYIDSSSTCYANIEKITANHITDSNPVADPFFFNRPAAPRGPGMAGILVEGL